METKIGAKRAMDGEDGQIRAKRPRLSKEDAMLAKDGEDRLSVLTDDLLLTKDGEDRLNARHDDLLAKYGEGRLSPLTDDLLAKNGEDRLDGLTDDLVLAKNGEDRLDGLTDDILLTILVRLDTTNEAARTSVLGRRWRYLWRSLQEVRLDPAPEGNRICELLLHAPDLQLQCLSVIPKEASLDNSTKAWLQAAAVRLVGSISYRHIDSDTADEAEGSLGIQLPCFSRATKIHLCLSLARMILPSDGVFTMLGDLNLSMVRFCGPCDIGCVVSTRRCPCLKALRVHLSKGLHTMSITSQSLARINLFGLILNQLTIVCPCLEELQINQCSSYDQAHVIGNISAPQLRILSLLDVSDLRFITLSTAVGLQCLKTKLIVYGSPNHGEMNACCLRLLGRFNAIHTLHLLLKHHPVGSHYLFLLGAITLLPQILLLHLELQSTGHDFGATIFHLLSKCSSVKRLVLDLLTIPDIESQTTCLSGCPHEHSSSWKTEKPILKDLDEVCVVMIGDNHEVAFLQRLLYWAPELRSMRVTFKSPTSKERIEEVYEALKASSSQAYIEFDTVDDQCTGCTSSDHEANGEDSCITSGRLIQDSGSACTGK